MHCCTGLTTDSQQGAECICSAPEMRKLANILKAVSLFNFKGKVLKQEDKMTHLSDTYHIRSIKDLLHCEAKTASQ